MARYGQKYELEDERGSCSPALRPPDLQQSTNLSSSDSIALLELSRINGCDIGEILVGFMFALVTQAKGMS